jgi:hypothetical protein
VTFRFKPRKWSDGEDLKNADFALGYKVACDRQSGNDELLRLRPHCQARGAG